MRKKTWNNVLTMNDLRQYLRTSYANARKIADKIPHSQINERGDLRFLKEDVDNFLRGNGGLNQ